MAGRLPDGKYRPQLEWNLAHCSGRSRAVESDHVHDTTSGIDCCSAGDGRDCSFNGSTPGGGAGLRDVLPERGCVGPQAMVQALRDGIFILMVPPLFICIGITYLAYRRRNLHNQAS